MKIHQYNEMMRWLTRPKVDPSIRQLAARDFYQGGRVGMKPGGLVEPGVVHYAKYPKKKGFVWDLDKKEFRKPKKRTGRPVTSPFVSEASNIVQAYKDYVMDAFNKGDMSTIKPFNGWINSEYPEKAKSAKAEIYKQKIQPDKFEIQKKKELVKKLISEANAGEKFVEIQAISKKISPSRGSLTDLGWMDKKDVVDFDGNPLETREQKVSKVFDNIRNEDSLLSLSKKPAAGLKHNGIFTQLIGERSGVNTAWVIRRGLDQNAWYKDNVKSMKYLRGYHAEDFIDMPFSEAFEFADERVGHRVNYKGRSKLRMFKDPNHNIMSWALRHWDGNNFAGKKTLEEGNRIQFFDKKENPITWEKDLKLNMGDVSFTYDGKPMKWNIKTLKTHGPKSGLFNQVYDVTKSYFTTMNKPVTYKGKTMPFGDLMKKIYGDKPISIGHEGIGGVRGEPFKNFKIMTQKMNSALGSVMKSIPQKSLRKKMINEIFGDLKSFKGQAWTDAMVNLEVKKAGQTIKGGLTPYVQAAKNILEREGTSLSKPEVQKLTKILKRADVKLIKNNIIANASPQLKNKIAVVLNCKTGTLNKAEGGRIGFAFGSGDPTRCITSKLEADPKGTLSRILDGVPEMRAPLAQTLGPDGWRFLGVDYGPGRTAQFFSKVGEKVARSPTAVRTPLQLTGKLATGVGRFLADPFFFPLIPLEMMVTSAYGFEKNKDNIMKSLKENPLVTEMARKYKMNAKDVRNAILEKYRRAVLNTEGGLEEQMAFEPKHDEVVETFDKKFYPFWDPDYQAVGPKKTDTSFVKDPAFSIGTGSALLGNWQTSEEEEHKLRSGEVGGTQFYKKPTYYTKKEFYPKDHPDKTLAEQLKSEKRIRFENLRGLENPLPVGFYGGGRVPFVKGKIVDEGRRAFMKWLAGITGATVAAGTGLLKWGIKKGTGKTVIKAGDHIIQGTKGMPDWFIPLINRIVKEGDDVTKKLGTVEREIVHTKKISKGEEVTVYQNLDTGNVRVAYGPVHPRPSNDLSTVHLEYRAPQVIDEGKYAGQKTKSEFDAVESEPKYVAVGPDDAEVQWDFDNVVGNVDDLTTDTSKLKEFGTKRKLTHKDKVKAKKKQKYRQQLEEDTSTQVDYSASKYGEGDDTSDLFDDIGNYIGD